MSANTQNRHATWLELFFDLIFVVAIAKTAHVLQHPHDGHIAAIDYIKYILILIPIWWAWVGATLFASRFECDDALQRIASLTQMFSIVVLAAHINTDFDTYYHGFLFSYLAIRALTVLMYMRAFVHSPEKKHVAKFLGSIFLIGALITASSIFFDSMTRYAVFYAGIAFEVVLPLLSKKRLRSVSVHAHHLPERFGLLTIILLGESVLSLTNSIDVLSLSPQQITMAVCGFILVCALWWGYFDNFESKISGMDLGHGHGILYWHLGVYAGLGAIASMVRYAIEPELKFFDYKMLSAFGIVVMIISMQMLFLIYNPKEIRLKIIRNAMLFYTGFVPLIVLAPSIPVLMTGTTILIIGYVALERHKLQKNQEPHRITSRDG